MNAGTVAIYVMIGAGIFGVVTKAMDLVNGAITARRPNVERESDWYRKEYKEIKAEVTQLRADFAAQTLTNAALKITVAEQQVEIVNLQAELWKLTNGGASRRAHTTVTSTATRTVATSTPPAGGSEVEP